MSAIRTVQTTGKLRSEIELISKYTFTLDGFEKKHFSSYYKLYWAADYVIHRMQNGRIRIDAANGEVINYIVYFTGELTRGKILDEMMRSKNLPAHQYALSFRVPNSEYRLPPIVLIKF